MRLNLNPAGVRIVLQPVGDALREQFADGELEKRRKPRAAFEGAKPAIVVLFQLRQDIKQRGFLLGLVFFDLLDDKRDRRNGEPQKFRRRGLIAGADARDERLFRRGIAAGGGAGRGQEKFRQRVIAHEISRASVRTC